MGRDDWEYEPRRRRDRYYDDDEDDYGRVRSERSGAVTGVAVINFVLGGIVLLFGLCGMLGVLVAAGEVGRGGGFQFPGVGESIGLAVLIVVLIVLWGIVAIVAGVGLVNRSQWGRVLTLILGGFAAVAGLFYLFAAFSALATPAGFGPGDPRILTFVVCVGLGLIFLGYCIWAYVVLLNSHYAAEFR